MRFQYYFQARNMKTSWSFNCGGALWRKKWVRCQEITGDRKNYKVTVQKEMT